MVANLLHPLIDSSPTLLLFLLSLILSTQIILLNYPLTLTRSLDRGLYFMKNSGKWFFFLLLPLQLPKGSWYIQASRRLSGTWQGPNKYVLNWELNVIWLSLNEVRIRKLWFQCQSATIKTMHYLIVIELDHRGVPTCMTIDGLCLWGILLGMCVLPICVNLEDSLTFLCCDFLISKMAITIISSSKDCED